MKNIFLSVVIPLYNEEKRIVKTLKILEKYFEKQTYQYEVIFVDDKSKDKTVEVINNEIKKHKQYRLLENKRNHGKGFSVKSGMLNAKGEFIMFTDADLSTPINELDNLLKYIRDYPVVIGSRYLNKDSIKVKQPFIRRIVSRVGNVVIRALLKLPFVDTQCGFKMFWHDAAKEIFSRTTIERWGFDMEILSIARIHNYKIKEVAVEWNNDLDSKLHIGSDAASTIRELITIRANIKKKLYV